MGTAEQDRSIGGGFLSKIFKILPTFRPFKSGTTKGGHPRRLGRHRGEDRSKYATAVNGQAACVKRLLQEGKCQRAGQVWQHSALRAAYEDNENIIKILLDVGADRTLTDNKGRTAS